METKNNNKILKLIQDIYNDYMYAPDELPRNYFFKLMFENKLIDVCDYNIFYLNHYVTELIQESDYLTYEQFLNLLLFIYGQQLKMIKLQKIDEETFNNIMTNEKENNMEKIISQQENDQNNELERDFPNDLNSMNEDSYKVILNGKDQITFSNYTIIKVLKSVREDNQTYVDIVIPDFDKGEKLFNKILTSESIYFSKNYSDPLYHIFCGNSSYLSEKNIQIMNISDLIRIFREKNINSNIESEVIANIIVNFLFPIKIKIKTDGKKFVDIFDDPKLKNNPELVESQFKAISLDSKKINFTFSSFVLILSSLAINIPESANKPILEAMEHFYKNVLEIESNDIFNKMDNFNEKSDNFDDDNILPESKNISEARRIQNNPQKLDLDYLLDSLNVLEKELPDLNNIINSNQNNIPNQSNTIYNNLYKREVIKFPLQTLKVELDEIAIKKQQDIEKAKIDKLKGAKKSNGKEPPPTPLFFDDMPNRQFEETKYFGEKKIETLRQRYLKNSFKDIMLNSSVYPCLIKEVMIIPKKLHFEVY